MSTHERYLQVVLEILAAEKLYVNRKKCTFARSQVKYLGHLVLVAGVAADSSKIEAMGK